MAVNKIKMMSMEIDGMMEERGREWYILVVVCVMKSVFSDGATSWKWSSLCKTLGEIQFWGTRTSKLDGYASQKNKCA